MAAPALLHQDSINQVIDWGEELERDIEGEKYEPSTVISGDRKFVTEFDEDPDTGVKKKIVSEYRIISKRVPRAVAQRKQWKKFGECENDPAGPQSRTTLVADEIPMQFITGREDVMATDAPALGVKDKANVTCRICGGDHWTSQCQFQQATEAEKEAIREKYLGSKGGDSVAMDAPMADSGGGGGKYVAPGRRAGASSGPSAMQQDALPSIRVSNLPPEIVEQDLRDLFDRFGKIKKVYLGKDKKTSEFKGFAFVTFYDQSSADNAIAEVNGHKYFHMILSVDWANPSKP